jgi:hypothetical protein
MSREPNTLLARPEVGQLVISVEEATRATKDAPRRFIEPADGTLNRAKSRRHHIVFGRRGSGKTSLLRNAGADLTLKRTPIAFIDLEAFKGHEYPDVLLSVLIESLNAVDSWLATAGSSASSKNSFWLKLFGRKPDRRPLDNKKLNEVRQSLAKEIDSLTELLHREDSAELVQENEASQQISTKKIQSLTAMGEISATKLVAKAKLGSRVNLDDQENSEHQNKTGQVKKTKRNKMGYLHRKIIDFQKIFDAIVNLSDGDAFIFLDGTI